MFRFHDLHGEIIFLLEITLQFPSPGYKDADLSNLSKVKENKSNSDSQHFFSLVQKTIITDKKFERININPILDGVRAYPILDGGGAKKPTPGLTLSFSV